jgi:Fe-S cluster assembly iron-binding protein IscA
MLQVTKSAIEKISEYFTDKELKPIRIFLLEGGCAPSSLALDVDEIKDADTVIEIDGFQFLVDEDLMREVAPIKVDYNRMSGFQFDCELEFEDTCSVCMSGDCG